MQALSQLSYGPETLSFEHDLFGKPFTTPHQVRGRLFPDHAPPARHGRRTGQNPEHNSGLISSLLVAADVADDVGDVLVAFFLVGDEGGIIIVVVFDGLVDLDVV